MHLFLRYCRGGQSVVVCRPCSSVAGFLRLLVPLFCLLVEKGKSLRVQLVSGGGWLVLRFFGHNAAGHFFQSVNSRSPPIFVLRCFLQCLPACLRDVHKEVTLLPIIEDDFQGFLE